MPAIAVLIYRSIKFFFFMPWLKNVHSIGLLPKQKIPDGRIDEGRT
jgi:hypothetical protein